MAAEEAPAYQWFVKDWRSSRAGQRMSFSERGVYREMLDEQWERRTLPDDPEAVAELITTTDAQRAEVIAAWPVVRRKFVTTTDGQIQNTRLERCRREYRTYLREKSKGGKARAAQALRGKDGVFQATSTPPAASQQVSSSRLAGIQPSSATATASSSATASATGAGRSAGSPPLSLGLQRLKIWRWMVEEFIDRLGEHADSFDLDAWIQQQDRTEQRAIGGNWGAYWSTAFDAEIRRRGIPLASTSKSIFTESPENEAKAVLAIVQNRGGIPR